MTLNESYNAFVTLFLKEIKRFLRIWPQTLVPPAVTMTLYFIIFGNFIGARIGEMGGFNYMQFIAPGLIMMSVITNSYSNVVSSFFSTKFQKSVEALLISPIPNFIIVAGYVIGGMARGLSVGAIVTIVALFFTDMPIYNAWVIVSVILLTSILFSLGGFINAIYADKFDDINIIPSFVLTPLIYLGGVFYSLDLLPEFWQSVSLINPIIYMVSTFRYGFLGTTDIPIIWALVMLALFSVALFMFALFLLKRGTGLRV